MAYPMNGWLVSRHFKHGTMTLRPSIEHASCEAHDGVHAMSATESATASSAAHAGPVNVSRRTLAGMMLLPFLLFAVGLGVAAYLGGFP